MKGRKDNAKIRLLAVAHMLKPGKTITSTQILDQLRLRYDIEVDRKTIISDIQAINMIVPVEAIGGKGGGYRLQNVLVEEQQQPFDKDGYICPYNQECRCQIVDCSSCGWNPAVEKRRLNKLLSQQGESNYAERNQKNRI